MKVSKHARREAKQLFRSCLVNGVLDENRARQAVSQMLALKPRGHMAVLGHFQRLLKLDAQRRAARVESAMALRPEVREAIRAGLERRYGPGLSLEFAENPALLGGMRVQVGSDVYDGSIRNRLDRVKEAFEAA
jgi:F-type H+-transporting ATPase subunit delta